MFTTEQSHILILGGSGRTCQLVIKEALHRSHPVTALIRKASSVPQQAGLTIVEGSPLNKSDLENALASIPYDKKIVIVSTLSQTRFSGNPWSAATSPKRLMADAMENVIAASKSNSRIAKVVVMSMFGTGASFQNNMFLMRWVFKTSNMDVTLEDHNLVDEAVKALEMNFVMVRATMLKGEEALPVKELGDEGEEAGWTSSVSRKSVTGFLLDAVEQSNWDGRTPVIANWLAAKGL